MEIYNRLAAVGKKWDAARPYTAAPITFDLEKLIGLFDVKGHNYGDEYFEPYQKENPDWTQIQTETGPDMFAQLGCWNMMREKPYITGTFVWSGFEYMGESWSGWVGLQGEAVGFPSYAAACGLIDIAGDPKVGQRYRNVVSGTSSIELVVLEPLPEGQQYARQGWSNPNEYPCWDWPEFSGKPVTVRVICRAPELRLSLNGKVIG